MQAKEKLEARVKELSGKVSEAKESHRSQAASILYSVDMARLHESRQLICCFSLPVQLGAAEA